MAGKAVDGQRQHTDIDQGDGQAAKCFGDGLAAQAVARLGHQHRPAGNLRLHGTENHRGEGRLLCRYLVQTARSRRAGVLFLIGFRIL